jgi:hypothetical protein
MSIKSTFGISREIAQQVILCSVYKLSNEELARILYDLPESTFRNYRVNGQGFSGDDESMINSVEEFFSSK